MRRACSVFYALLGLLLLAWPAAAQLKLTGIRCTLTPAEPVDHFNLPVVDADQKSWKISNGFGSRVTNKDVPGLPSGTWQHTGLDYLINGRSKESQDQPVYAAANGVVVFSTESNKNPNPSRGGLIIIRHLAPPGRRFMVVGYKGVAGSYEPFETEEIYTYYLHLDTDKILVKNGDQVTGGTQIAQTYNSNKVGTKYAYVPHLHFEVWSTCSNIELNGYERDGDLGSSLRQPVIDPVSFLSNVRMTGGKSASLSEPKPTPLPKPLPSLPKPLPKPPTPKLVDLPTLFLLDTSSSMRDDDKITQAKNSGLNAVREMQANRQHRREQSLVSIWTFGGNCSQNNIRELLPQI